MPTINDWPLAVRSAEVLRGTLVRCGPGLRLVAWPDGCRVRAAALEPWFTEHRVAVRMSAAWIWGAATHPGKPLRFGTLGGRRAGRVTGPILTLQQLRLASDDVTYCDTYAVTAPLRTAADLLRDPERFDVEHRVACRLLLTLVPEGRPNLESSILEGPSAYRRVALHRLSQC